VTSPIQTPDSNRNRIVLFGALGVVVLLAAVLLPRMLSGGGDDDLGPPPDASGSSGSTTTTTEPVDEVAAGVVPEAFSTKNPFTPLVDATPAPTAATDTAIPDGTTSGVTGDVPASTPTDTGTGSTEPASASFSLVDVYAGPDGAPVATVEVDGSMYTVAEGETFAGGYTVVSLSIESKSGVFTSPSDGGTFSPSAGESVLK
jgi:hypothetical protein